MFEKIRETYLEEYQGFGTLYRHKASKMEVFHIKNESEELSCAFMFATPSRDDMGVAHILEHTVLAGSERYPVKDPFDAVIQSSPNTFMNAITYTDKTVFPFASPLKKDFDILFDIYADSVFAPLLRKENFEQQGVRFFENKFDGVVYNEMCGASSSEDDFVSDFCMRKLYEGTPAKFNSGGDPVYIADLTYEEFKNRYKAWYSPANCRLFLYGNLEVEEYLEKLEKLYLFDENLKKWTGEKFIPSPEKYIGKEYEISRDKVLCPVKNASGVVMTWLTKPATDSLETLTINVLTDILLGDPGAPLYKAATESKLGKDLNSVSGTDVDFPLLPFIYGFTGAQKDKEDEIEAFIMGELNKIVENGLDPLSVEAAIKRQEFRLQEIRGGETPFGLSVAFKSARTWLRGKDPEDAIVVKPVIQELRKLVSKGHYFEDWIQENLIENPRRCLLTVCYGSNCSKERKMILDKKLKERINGYDSKQFADDKEAFNSFVDSEDSEEALNTIPRIQISDMPNKIPVFKQDKEIVNGSVLYKFPEFTRGIVYCNLAFSTIHLSLEEKKLLPLLARLLEMCSTEHYDYVKLGTLLKLYFGGFSFSLSNGTDNENNLQSFVFIKSKMLYEDTEKAFDLLEEILIRSRIDDEERIKATILDICTEFESEYLYNANRFAIFEAGSKVSSSMLENELTGGTSCYLYMKSLQDENTDYSNLSGQLTNLKKKIFNLCGLTAQIATEEQYIDSVITSYKKRICGVKCDNLVRSANLDDQYFNKRDKKDSFLTVSSGPSYCALVTPVNDEDQKKLIAKLLLASALSSGKLWDVVRGKNGAYGVYASVNLQEKLHICVSYRDPNIEKTFQAYLDCLDSEVSKEEIDYVIVNIIGRELKPLTPQAKALEAMKRVMYKMTDELYLERRKVMFEITSEDIALAAKELKLNAIENGSKAVVCSEEKIKGREGVIITHVGL